MTITREHLELAALAAGMRVAAGYVAAHDDLTAIVLESGEEWRPHLDDGDAARLAVRVGIITQPQISAPVVNAWMTGWKYQGVREHVRHDGTEPDKLRAWREAVVLCAAAVGERMRKGGA
jgi:hypothetical protein